jgi:hypothetical protein
MAAAVFGLSGVALVMALAGTPVARALPALTTTPSPTPTTTKEPPIFSATLSIASHRPALLVGETLTVTVDIDVSEGCQYPIFELSLIQNDSESPIFAHIEPAEDMITGPIVLPSVWTFQATAPGVATFDARTFGERYCGDYWNWHYLNGQSGPVVVGEMLYEYWLPSVSRH